MNRLIRAHPDVTRPLVDKVFSFEDSVEALAYLDSQKHVGKVVIKVSKD
jgi:NADPH:quinone reductase-like Zn-dependent oxidoreductase